MRRAQFNRKFFDPRPPGPKRRNGADLVSRFNALNPVGTPIRVWTLHRDMDSSKETVVKAPGAFVNSAGYAVVKIPGDCIALTHVEVLTDRPVTDPTDGGGNG